MKIEKFIDLHTHSTFSDGADSPTQVVRHAKECGLSAIALTDHDTVSGLDEAIEAGKEYGIEVIPAIELSGEYVKEMHILGFYINHKDENLVKALASIQNFRANRNTAMIQKAIDMGFDIDFDDVLSVSENLKLENVGRIHLAKVFYEHGYAPSVNEAFEKYLRPGMPLYMDKHSFSPKQCVELIKNAGGLAYLAHPIYIDINPISLENLFLELKGYGLDGVECIYNSHVPEYEQILKKICDFLDMGVCGGSDYHGSNKPHVKIGKVYDDKNIPYEILDRIKAKLPF